MEAPRRAAIGLALVAASQGCYLVGSMVSGFSGLGPIFTILTLAGAGTAAWAVANGQRAAFFWGLLAMTIAQAIDLATSARGVSTFLVGWILFLTGLVVCSVSARRWMSVPESRATGVAWGAALASLGAASYIIGGIVSGGSPSSFFGVGAVVAFIGWTFVVFS